MEHISDHNFNYFKLTLEAEKHMVRFKQIRNIENTAASKRAKNARRLTFKHKEITRKLKDLAPAPMTCLRRNRTTGAHRIKGTLTTDFEEIDNIIHDVMGGIIDGTARTSKQPSMISRSSTDSTCTSPNQAKWMT